MSDELIDIEEARDELLGVMRDFSQENWAASWLYDLEIESQNLIDGDDSILFLTSREQIEWYKMELTRLHDIVHGWWVWLGEKRRFMSDSAVKAYHAVEAEWFNGFNEGDIDVFAGIENFVSIEHEGAAYSLEFVDKFQVKHTVTEDHWVVREADGRILVLDAEKFIEYIKPEETK